MPDKYEEARRALHVMGEDLTAEEWADRLGVSKAFVYKERQKHREKLRPCRTAVEEALKCLAFGDIPAARYHLRGALDDEDMWGTPNV